MEGRKEMVVQKKGVFRHFQPIIGQISLYHVGFRYGTMKEEDCGKRHARQRRKGTQSMNECINCGEKLQIIPADYCAVGLNKYGNPHHTCKKCGTEYTCELITEAAEGLTLHKKVPFFMTSTRVIALLIALSVMLFEGMRNFRILQVPLAVYLLLCIGSWFYREKHKNRLLAESRQRLHDPAYFAQYATTLLGKRKMKSLTQEERQELHQWACKEMEEDRPLNLFASPIVQGGSVPMKGKPDEATRLLETAPFEMYKRGQNPGYVCDGKLVIPEGITEIENGMFSASNRDTSGIVMVEMSETVESIGNQAFEDCKNLQKVVMKGDVKSIGSKAFRGCASLTEIRIPGSVKAIGIRAFEDCKNLQDLIIEEGVEKIGISAFEGCERLARIQIPGSIKTVENWLFRNCTNLQEAIIEEGVEQIAKEAFLGCKKLVAVQLPASLKFIGMSAFEGCESLREVTIPEGVTDMDRRAFRNCGKLVKVRIPASLKTIASLMFEGCKNLQEVILSDGVESIGAEAFRGCESLVEVQLPASVKYIDGCAFQDCRRLKKVIMPEGAVQVAEDAFKGCEELTIQRKSL